MQAPTKGTRYRAANGNVYIVEAVVEFSDDGMDGFSVEMIDEAHAGEMDAIGFDFTEREFAVFCESEGLKPI